MNRFLSVRNCVSAHLSGVVQMVLIYRCIAEHLPHYHHQLSDNQLVTSIIRNGKAVRSIYVKACGIIAVVPFVVFRIFDFYFSAHAAKFIYAEKFCCIRTEVLPDAHANLFPCACNKKFLVEGFMGLGKRSIVL